MARAARLALRPVNDLLRSVPDGIIVHYPDVAAERLTAARVAWDAWIVGNDGYKAEAWALEAQAALDAADARLAEVRANPSGETAPAQEELEAAALEGPEPWEAEPDTETPVGEPPVPADAPSLPDGTAPNIPPPVGLDEAAVANGYARIAGASDDVTQVLLEKKALQRRVAELDTFLSSVKLQSRCGGCGALLAFIADRNEVDCPRCKTRLRIEGLFLLRK